MVGVSSCLYGFTIDRILEGALLCHILYRATHTVKNRNQVMQSSYIIFINALMYMYPDCVEECKHCTVNFSIKSYLDCLSRQLYSNSEIPQIVWKSTNCQTIFQAQSIALP